MAGTQEGKPDLYGQACTLIGQARSGSLATVTDGVPFAALVTPAFMPDLSGILLLSQLSPHTRHLAVHGACALLLIGQAPTDNPQTAPRICLSGTARVDTEPEVRARFLEVHPYAAQYVDFGDFSFWRLSFAAAHFIGGFAAAAKLDVAQLRENFRLR